MAKIHLRKKHNIIKNVSKKNLVIVIIFSIIICLFFFIDYVGNKIAPLLLEYGETEIRRFATAIINKSISDSISEMNVDELIKIENDTTGEVKSFDFNPLILNNILTTLSSNVQKNLKNIEKGNLSALDLEEDFFLDYDKEKLTKGIIYEIPIGIVSNNVLLSNLGPKIPIKLSLIGDITSNITTNIKNYGINNALIEIAVTLEVKEKVVLPFTSKPIAIVTNVPIGLKLIEGIVPKYYLSGFQQNSPILTLPVE